MVRNPSTQSHSEVSVMKKLNIDPAHSNKPSAIEYRLKRAHSAASVALQFLEGVDPTAGESNIGTRLLEARKLAHTLETLVDDIRKDAPQKRVHVKRADKPAPAPKGKRGRPRKVRPTDEVQSLDAALEAVSTQLTEAPVDEVGTSLQNAAE
jgi:hypothetical protein